MFIIYLLLNINDLDIQLNYCLVNSSLIELDYLDFPVLVINLKKK